MWLRVIVGNVCTVWLLFGGSLSFGGGCFVFLTLGLSGLGCLFQQVGVGLGTYISVDEMMLYRFEEATCEPFLGPPTLVILPESTEVLT